MQMNYARYEHKIVQSVGVALDGWPINGRVRNPGDLTCVEATILRGALVHGMCKWVILTPDNNDVEMEDIIGASGLWISPILFDHF